MEISMADRVSVKFMLLMPWGRVGSNLLLNGIGQVMGPAKRNFANETFNSLRDAVDQAKWLDDFYGNADGYDLIGSKQNRLSVTDPAILAGALERHGVKLVKLRRANLIKVAISNIRAEQYAAKTAAETGKASWGVRKGDQALPATEVDCDYFIQTLSRVVKADQLLLDFAADCAMLEVDYEEIRVDPIACVDRVVHWMGLEPRKAMVPAFEKATPDRLEDAVLNLPDLEKALSASPYAALAPFFAV